MYQIFILCHIADFLSFTCWSVFLSECLFVWVSYFFFGFLIFYVLSVLCLICHSLRSYGQFVLVSLSFFRSPLYLMNETSGCESVKYRRLSFSLSLSLPLSLSLLPSLSFRFEFAVCVTHRKLWGKFFKSVNPTPTSEIYFLVFYKYLRSYGLYLYVL